MPQAKPGLETYNAKRDFNKTPEPAGKPEKGGREFVVQHHLATRDHYDLRLEIAGVLVSWAVTRGPSANPADKRLAVRTEDHPLSYRSFEGTIPKGAYGAGTVQLWEFGTYAPKNGDPAAALAKGEIKFEAQGRRMHGGWVLVRMKTQEKRENWLLIKERDQFAEANSQLLERYPDGVLSGLSLEQIAAKPARNDKPREAAKAVMPAFVAPQLCASADAPPEGKNWLFEMKYDGYRLQLAKAGADVRLFTRSGLDWTAKFGVIAKSAQQLSCISCLLDGEAAVLNAAGISDFPALVAALESGATGNVVYIAFDLLKLNDEDLRGTPLSERKERLRQLIPQKNGAIRSAAYWDGDGEELLQSALAAGAEGIIAKRRDCLYRSGRSDDWQKIKGDRRTDAIVIGYMPSAKHGSFASLLAAEETPDGLRYTGRIGTGYNARVRKQLLPLLASARATAPNVTLAERIPRGAVFVKAPFSAEVAFGGWTQDRQLRQARFLGVQKDRDIAKLPKGRNSSAKIPPPPAGAPDWSVSHPTRVVFPDSNVTKNDIARYYEGIFPRIAPHLAERPVSLLRAPESIDKELFFQRHPLPGMKGGITRVGAPPPGEYFALVGAEGIHTAVQFGAIEFHGWNAKAPDIDHPDRMIFDLDPDESLPFAKIIDAAQMMRDYLQAAGIRSWPLLSGGKGIHLVVPLDAITTADDVTLFSSQMAKGVAREKPDIFVATMSKAQRRGRIFIDWLRNRSKATAIVPWSLRARPGAPVATPVTWTNLSRCRRANAFTIRSASEAEDWTDFWQTPQTIQPGLMQYLRTQNW